MEPQVFLGIDVGKTEHHATAVNRDGEVVHDKPLPQAEPKIQQLLKDLAAKHGELLVVVDQPQTIGVLVIAVAQQLGIQVAYLPGLMIRRVADLHPGQAKTDARDAKFANSLHNHANSMQGSLAVHHAHPQVEVEGHLSSIDLTPPLGVRYVANGLLAHYL